MDEAFAAEHNPPGTKMSGVIKNITDFGLFIDLAGDNLDGSGAYVGFVMG